MIALNLITLYLLLGAIFAPGFVFFWIKRLDPVAAHASMIVRCLWLPGCVLTWPFLLYFLLRRASP